jgi:hypothetical protein
MTAASSHFCSASGILSQRLTGSKLFLSATADKIAPAIWCHYTSGESGATRYLLTVPGCECRQVSAWQDIPAFAANFR